MVCRLQSKGKAGDAAADYQEIALNFHPFSISQLVLPGFDLDDRLFIPIGHLSRHFSPGWYYTP
jgi:hypothetical protein